MSIDGYPALALNADFRPLSYFPLSLWSWQEALKAVFLDRVSVISEYDVKARSPSQEFALPSVIALKEYIPMNRRPAFTRFNVFLRDGFTCQYCGNRYENRDLNLDHVIPREKGGPTTWENVVCSCIKCNTRKANKLPVQANMFPLTEPRKPRWRPFFGQGAPKRLGHSSWSHFVGSLPGEVLVSS